MRELMYCQVSRKEIESGVPGSATEDLYKLKDGAWIHKLRLDVIIKGYEEDPRKLWDIPEVCSWYAELVQTVPVLVPMLELSSQLDSMRCTAKRLGDLFIPSSDWLFGASIVPSYVPVLWSLVEEDEATF